MPTKAPSPGVSAPIPAERQANGDGAIERNSVTTDNPEALAARLAMARLSGSTIDFPVLTLAQGTDIARRLARHLGPVIGWKIGATSAGAMAFLKVGRPIHGRLFNAWQDGAAIRFPGDRPVEVEPEILFTLGPDLQPQSVRFGIEFNRPSFANPFTLGAGSIVADNAASLGVLLGPVIPLATLDDPAALVASLDIDGQRVATGSADAVLGNPRTALAALQTALASDPRGLQPGDIIASGAMSRSALLSPGQSLRIDAGPWGSAVAQWAA